MSVASTLEEDQSSVLSVNHGKITISDSTHSTDNATAQVEVSMFFVSHVIVIILQ